MDSRELVHRAIERTGPDRVPLHYCNRDREESDVFSIGYRPARGFVPSEPGMTEWGYVWESLDDTMGQPCTHPLSELSAFAGFVPPDPYAPGRMVGLEEAVSENAHRFVRFGLGITGFNAATFIRGFEAFLEDLASDRPHAEQVLDWIFGFENAMIEQALALPIDCIAFGDDWGTQRGLIISPRQWREVFKPLYAQQFAWVHQAGKKVWFHSCGDVLSIIPDLIECGVDVLELLQPDIFGVDLLAERFGGQVCFCNAVDHQRRAVTGTREEIRAYALLLKERLGAFNGGFIGYIEDYASLGMDEDHYQWIREAFRTLPPYEWEAAICPSH